MITQSETTTYETKEQTRQARPAVKQTYLEAKEAYIKASLANEPADNDN